MLRVWLMCFISCLIFLCVSLEAQQPTAQEPADIQAELRSATGSNHFQLGEVISLDFIISSSTPNRYLAPCNLFNESCFGFPQCRFFTHWSFSVAPESGWTQIGGRGCETMSGPNFQVPSRDLTAEPEKLSYTLTNRFRFDKPGTYIVRLSMQVGLDDESNFFGAQFGQDAEAKRHAVSLSREIVLEIAPAGEDWKKNIIEKGVAAWSGVVPRSTNPVSLELLQYEQEKSALCHLGTPEAAVALIGLLSQGHNDAADCLPININSESTVKEMRRLMADPETSVSPTFFSMLVELLNSDNKPGNRRIMISQAAVDKEREALFAALPRKQEAARIASLATILQNPPHSNKAPAEFSYPVSFSLEEISVTATNFDRLPGQVQERLLGDGWNTVRSLLMLPVVRRMAEAGNGQALLRWLDLDSVAATAFIRQEVVRPVPRFSAYYLRLAETSLPGQEQQIASNFIALDGQVDVMRGATLLQRYITGSVLPIVLPFINAKFDGWSCVTRVPVIAYLLKYSPDDAEKRLEQMMQDTGHGYCQSTGYFTNIGFLQPSPVLERMAIAQIQGDTPFARDGIEYLQRYGTTASKQILWNQLVTWHEKFVASGAEKRLAENRNSQDDYALRERGTELARAFSGAQNWMLLPDEASRLQSLLGKDASYGLACAFSCGAQLGIEPAPATYYIYAHQNEPELPSESRIEYLKPAERMRYAINQYRCADMKSLKNKLLQFPQGSTFDFAWEFSGRDRAEVIEITNFLQDHGFKFRNSHEWSFIRPDPPH